VPLQCDRIIEFFHSVQSPKRT